MPCQCVMLVHLYLSLSVSFVCFIVVSLGFYNLIKTVWVYIHAHYITNQTVTTGIDFLKKWDVEETTWPFHKVIYNAERKTTVSHKQRWDWRNCDVNFSDVPSLKQVYIEAHQLTSPRRHQSPWIDLPSVTSKPSNWLTFGDIEALELTYPWWHWSPRTDLPSATSKPSNWLTLGDIKALELTYPWWNQSLRIDLPLVTSKHSNWLIHGDTEALELTFPRQHQSSHTISLLHQNTQIDLPWVT